MAKNGQNSVKTYQRLGVLLVFLLVVCLGGWAAWAQISGAVIAQATVVVETNSKKVQHLEGGIVSEIHVRNGVYVEAGELLVRLDETETRAGLAIVSAQLNELQARQARLEAERDMAERITFPNDLTGISKKQGVTKILSGQITLFEARRKARAGKKEQLNQRILQLDEEIRGLKAQQDSKEQQVELIGNELEGLLQLREKELVPVTRILSLQREKARLEGERGQIVADIARTKRRIGETKLSIIQIDQDLQTEVLSELRDAQTKIAELLEQRVAAEARLKRTKIDAPRSGYIHQLDVHTIGGVVTAGEPLMLIVPKSDTLVLEAQVEPQKIDQVRGGQTAIVRFSAFDQSTTPELNGEVFRVSADLTQTSDDVPAYYTVWIRLATSELQRISDQDLKPGMPAEVFIQTGNRTALSYLLKPLTDQIKRTFRER